MAIFHRILLLSVVMAAGGCLHTEHSLILQPDGSGTLSVAYAVPAATLQMMSDGDAMDFDRDQIRQDFTEKAVPGVTLLDVKVKKSDAGQAVGLKMGFEALADISHTEFYQESRLSLERTGAGTYRFTQMPNAPRERPRGQEEVALMKGFRFTMNITVPGQIVSTSADHVETGKATWIFDLNADPQALERMEAMVYQIEFAPSGKDLPEYRRPRVRLHPPPARPDPFTEAAP